MPPTTLNNMLGSVLSLIKSRVNRVCASTCDGLVLRMHYRWTFVVFLGCTLSVWYKWYNEAEIVCASHFNAEKQVHLDFINICLSYPFLEINGTRRYLLFYRWISYSFVILASIYYIPRKISKNFDSARCKQLLEDLAANAHRYDVSEKLLVDRVANYMLFNLKTHNGLYWKYLVVNFVCVFTDVIAMFFLDFLLQGRFIQYGVKSFPFERDPQNFTDYMSQTFPPFASCELADEHQLVNTRKEIFGCHLTLMELYEKVFLGLWFWFIFLIIINCSYIIFLFSMGLPCVQAYLLKAAKPAHVNETVHKTVNNVLKNCKIGDIYLLYRLKSHISHARFYEVLQRISDPNLFGKQVQRFTPPDVVGESTNEELSFKNSMSTNKSQNTQTSSRIPNYFQLLTPQQMSKTTDLGQNPEQQILLPKKGDIGILID